MATSRSGEKRPGGGLCVGEQKMFVRFCVIWGGADEWMGVMAHSKVVRSLPPWTHELREAIE